MRDNRQPRRFCTFFMDFSIGTRLLVIFHSLFKACSYVIGARKQRNLLILFLTVYNHEPPDVRLHTPQPYLP